MVIEDEVYKFCGHLTPRNAKLSTSRMNKQPWHSRLTGK